MKYLIRLLLCLCIFFTLFSCSNQSENTNNGNTVTVNNENNDVDLNPVEVKTFESFYKPSEKSQYGDFLEIWNNETITEAYRRYRKFAYNSFNNSLTEGQNEIFSPFSLYYALSILANGADNNTKKELETVLEMNTDDLNNFLSDLDNYNNAGWGKLYEKANALWFNTDLGNLKSDYKNTINEYYGNSIYEQSFKNRNEIVNDVNSWSNEMTDGAIENILDENDIKDDTIFLILNALAAGGDWSLPFDKNLTFYEDFINYAGQRKLTEMMHETMFGYWSDKGSEGFVKETMTGLYFVAILPKEGTDIYDYLNSSDENLFYDLVNSERTEDVVGSYKSEYGGECPILDLHYTNLAFPKFKYEKEYDLNDTLKNIGLINLYDQNKCDLSLMADGPLYLQSAKQKCTIELDEEKVVAAAVTALSGGKGGGDCAQIRDRIYHDVVFNRPFIYALCFQRNEVPLFIGIVNDIGDNAESAFRIKNITGAINIRNNPSAKAEKLGTYTKDSIVYAFETKEAEGYTWYRIGDNKWVADDHGEWIEVLD